MFAVWHHVCVHCPLCGGQCRTQGVNNQRDNQENQNNHSYYQPFYDLFHLIEQPRHQQFSSRHQIFYKQLQAQSIIQKRFVLKFARVNGEQPSTQLTPKLLQILERATRVNISEQEVRQSSQGYMVCLASYCSYRKMLMIAQEAVNSLDGRKKSSQK